MSNSHRTERYGEVWPQYRVDAYHEVIEAVREKAVISGGWAWHFLSPRDHIELKHAHDHSDMDLMVPPHNVGTVVGMLKGMGFKKVATRFDGKISEEEFRRYEKVVDDGEHRPFRLTIDFFVRDVPYRSVPGFPDGGDVMVVDPKTLLSLYSTIHSSKSCFAVVAAIKLMAWGEDPQGREELVSVPDTRGLQSRFAR